MASIIDADLIVISGIPNGNSGTGRFVNHLKKCIEAAPETSVGLACRPERPVSWIIKIFIKERKYATILRLIFKYGIDILLFWYALLVLYIFRGKRILLLHPQNLGYKYSLRLLETRKHVSVLYLLDSSFFCISSYNFRSSSNLPCVNCLGLDASTGIEYGCKPFPSVDWAAIEFTNGLRQLVRNDRVKIIAQNVRQAELAQLHFELDVLPKYIGLWTDDWDQVFYNYHVHSDFFKCEFDVVFHGHCLDAKGASWLISVAAECQDVKFFFPFAKPETLVETGNCIFQACTWENGLAEKVATARMVVVPSLWSAPIEGALVKSICCSKAVAVVNNLTSFSDELPDGLVLKLPLDPLAAAEILKCAVSNDWIPDPSVKQEWVRNFKKIKNSFFYNLVSETIDRS